MACVAVYSCDKTVIDGELPSNVGGKNSIDVLKSSIIFSPDASEGYVLVKAEGKITARSNRDWCSVECFGDSVAVRTAANHNDLSNRYAQVIIYHKKDSVALNVHQEGPLTASFDDSAVVLGYAGGEGEIVYRSNMIADVTSNVSWATAEAEKGRIVVYIKRNNAEEYRAGVLTCKLGSEIYKVPVVQLDPVEILSKRNWKLEGTLMDGSSFSLTGVISKLGSNYTMKLTGNSIDWSCPVSVIRNELSLTLGQSIGTYNKYYVFPAVGEGEEIGTSSSMRVSGPAGFVMSIDKDNGKWTGGINVKPFANQFAEPVFRFEYWVNSSLNGYSSGGFRFKELTVTQQ